MALLEHIKYNPELKKFAEENDNIILAVGRPNLKIGEDIGNGRIIKELYTVAVVGTAEQEELPLGGKKV